MESQVFYESDSPFFPLENQIQSRTNSDLTLLQFLFLKCASCPSGKTSSLGTIQVYPLHWIRGEKKWVSSCCWSPATPGSMTGWIFTEKFQAASTYYSHHAQAALGSVCMENKGCAGANTAGWARIHVHLHKHQQFVVCSRELTVLYLSPVQPKPFWALTQIPATVDRWVCICVHEVGNVLSEPKGH